MLPESENPTQEFEKSELQAIRDQLADLKTREITPNLVALLELLTLAYETRKNSDLKDPALYKDITATLFTCALELKDHFEDRYLDSLQSKYSIALRDENVFIRFKITDLTRDDTPVSVETEALIKDLLLTKEMNLDTLLDLQNGHGRKSPFKTTGMKRRGKWMPIVNVPVADPYL